MASESALGAELTLSLFKLNGQMLSAGEALTRPVGLTVARWQVLGACLREPQTASGISRQMGISRQAVQRVANRLLAESLLASSDNPAHKRAPLLAATQAGRDAIKRIAPEQTAFSQRIVKAFGRAKLESLISELQRLSAVIDETSPERKH
ncbi:MarR family transcriptional regulator [Candidatus Bipolaricaulota bacterium]|nr:MarR family transcriptional regulator [Candidatus Bipolaricaulota bacterium]